MPTIFFWYEESSSAFLCERDQFGDIVAFLFGGRTQRDIVLGNEIGGTDLEGGEDDMSPTDEANDHRTLFDGFLGVFDLEYPALR
jgi:hypothetical protein